MINRASATLDRIGTQAIVFDVCFLSDVPVARSLHFVEDNGLHIYIDVSDDSLPIALSLVHGPQVAIEYEEVPSSTELPFRDLFAFAAKLIALDEEGTTLQRESRNAASAPSRSQFKQRLIWKATRRLRWNAPASVA